MLFCNFIDFISKNVNNKYVRVVYKELRTKKRYTLFSTSESQNIENVFDEWFNWLIDKKYDNMIDFLLSNCNYQVLTFNDNTEIIIILSGFDNIYELLSEC